MDPENAKALDRASQLDPAILLVSAAERLGASLTAEVLRRVYIARADSADRLGESAQAERFRAAAAVFGRTAAELEPLEITAPFHPAHPAPKRTLITVAMSDVPEYVPPEFPKVVRRGKAMALALEDGRECDVSPDPLEFLGLLRHLAKKTWVDGEFVRLAIERVAEARGWKLGRLGSGF